jgi:hypothetical protein
MSCPVDWEDPLGYGQACPLGCPLTSGSFALCLSFGLGGILWLASFGALEAVVSHDGLAASRSRLAMTGPRARMLPFVFVARRSCCIGLV